MKKEKAGPGTNQNQPGNLNASTLPTTASLVNQEVYGTSPLKKRARRTSDEMDTMLASIQRILASSDDPITIRHLYYRLVGEHVIEKTEAAYKGLCTHLSKWRRSEDIPWDAFVDSTRWHIKSRTFDGIEDALRNVASTYRRDMWSTQACYIEVWVEKDAIAGIVSDTANSFGVPVFVCRGFSSLSGLYGAANIFREAIKVGKRSIIYHLGDHDPSGVAAGQAALAAFRDDFNVELEFTRVAVTQEQIQRLNLPTRPVKTSDSRAKNWTGGECVELDTIPPAEIKKLVEDCIVQHIEPRAWRILKAAEKDEREKLKSIWRSAA